MNEELNKKLAEWAGFYVDKYGLWKTPNSEPYVEDGFGCWLIAPRFTESLDACFKWLVPKANEVGWRLRLIQRPESRLHWAAHLIEYGKAVNKQDRGQLCAFSEASPLAICLAIEKLMEVDNVGTKRC